MRTLGLALIVMFGLFALAPTVQASPVPPKDVAGGSALVLVRGGCGPGWHPQVWQGRYGRWHRRCVPNRRPY